jgi:3-phenylpropionate/trans-cinnamate dioxygenase ferredoxin reductase subunit
LVIATGVAARRLDGQPRHPAIHVLRTVDDSVALRQQLERATSLLVVGGGFIGAEVAAVARSRGLDVTLVEAQHVPFERTMGALAGAACAQLHSDNGVRIRCAATVSELSATGGAAAVRLDDGTVLEADCVVVGVGTVPNVQWLRGSGARVGNGVRCDGAGHVEGLDDAYAVGDVAAWHDPVVGACVRVEHWTSATEQAGIVARAVAGAPALRATMGHTPYFWSDQYATKIQLVGRPALADDVRLLHGGAGGDPTLFGYFRRRRLVAAASFAAPRLIARYRPLVAAQASEAEVLAEVAAAC